MKDPLILFPMSPIEGGSGIWESMKTLAKNMATLNNMENQDWGSDQEPSSSSYSEQSYDSNMQVTPPEQEYDWLKKSNSMQGQWTKLNTQGVDIAIQHQKEGKLQLVKEDVQFIVDGLGDILTFPEIDQSNMTTYQQQVLHTRDKILAQLQGIFNRLQHNGVDTHLLEDWAQENNIVLQKNPRMNVNVDELKQAIAKSQQRRNIQSPSLQENVDILARDMAQATVNRTEQDREAENATNQALGASRALAGHSPTTRHMMGEVGNITDSDNSGTSSKKEEEESLEQSGEGGGGGGKDIDDLPTPIPEHIDAVSSIKNDDQTHREYANDTIWDLEETNEALHKSLQEAADTLNKHKTHINDLRRKVSNLTSANRTKGDTIIFQSKKLDELARFKQVSENTLSNLNNQLNRISNTRDSLIKTITTNDEVSQNDKLELDKLKQQNKDLKAQVHTISNEYAQYVNELEKKLDQNGLAFAGLFDTLDEQAHKIQSANTTVDIKNTALEQINKEKEQAKDMIRHQQNQIEELKQDMEQKTDTFKLLIGKCGAHTQGLDEVVQQLEDENQYKAKRIQTLEELNGLAQDVITVYKKQKDKAQDALWDVDILHQQKMEEIKQKYDDDVNRLEETNLKQADKLKEKDELLEKRNNGAIALDIYIHKMETKLTKHLVMAKDLVKDAQNRANQAEADTQAFKDAFDIYKTINEAYAQELTQTEKESTRRREALAEARKQIKEAEDKKKNLQVDYDNQTKNWKADREHIQDLENENNKVKREALVANNRGVNAEFVNKTLEQRTKELEANLKQTKTQYRNTLHAAQNKIGEARSRAQDAENHYAGLLQLHSQHANESKQTKSDLEKANAELWDARNKLEEARHAQEQELLSYSDNINRYRTVLQSLTTKASQMQVTNQQLSEEKDKQTKEISNLNDQLRQIQDNTKKEVEAATKAQHDEVDRHHKEMTTRQLLHQGELSTLGTQHKGRLAEEQKQRERAEEERERAKQEVKDARDTHKKNFQYATAYQKQLITERDKHFVAARQNKKLAEKKEAEANEARRKLAELQANLESHMAKPRTTFAPLRSRATGRARRDGSRGREVPKIVRPPMRPMVQASSRNGRRSAAPQYTLPNFVTSLAPAPAPAPSTSTSASSSPTHVTSSSTSASPTSSSPAPAPWTSSSPLNRVFVRVNDVLGTGPATWFDGLTCDKDEIGRDRYVELSPAQTRTDKTLVQSANNLLQTIYNTQKLKQKQKIQSTLSVLKYDTHASYKAYRQDRDMWFYATSDPYQVLVPMLEKTFAKQVTIVVPADPNIPGGRYKEGGFDVEALLTQNTSYLCNLTKLKLDESNTKYNNPNDLKTLRILDKHVLINNDASVVHPIGIMAQWFDPEKMSINEFVVDQMAYLVKQDAEVIVFYPQGIWSHGHFDFATTMHAYRQAIYVAKKSRKVRAVVLVVPEHIVKTINKTIGARTLDMTKIRETRTAFPVDIPKIKTIASLFKNWMSDHTKLMIEQIENHTTPLDQPHIGAAFDKHLIRAPLFQLNKSTSPQRRRRRV